MSGTSSLCLVTGASRGLGRALAREAAARGAHVLALARTVGGLEELDDAIRAAGGAATLIPLDLTDAEGVARLAAAIAGRWGRLDLWLHCAVHAPPLTPLPQLEAADLDRALAVNARATQRLIAALDPLLRAAPAGRAVLFDEAREGEPFFGAYAASKAAARALWSAWARERARTGPVALIMRPPSMPTATRARFYPGEAREGLTPPAQVAASAFARLDGAVAPGEIIDL